MEEEVPQSEPAAPPAAPAEAPASPPPAPAAPPPLTRVSALRPGTSGHNLLVKVVEVKPPVSVPRPDGSATRIVEALVGDASGAIILTARNAQADLLKVGAVLSVSNARINMFQGTPRLAADRGGAIAAAEEGVEVEPQTELNLSLIEYDLVAV